MKKFLLSILVSIFYAPVVWAENAQAQSLCTQDEKDLFTCHIEKKLVSVCASPDLSKTAGYVQYRFGYKNHPPELVYPSEKAHSVSKFSYGHQDGAQAGLENLFFTQSGYSYTIYRSYERNDESSAGIIIGTPERKFSALKCKEEHPPSDLYELNDVGVRHLPEVSLTYVYSSRIWPAEWPADSPNADLLWGVRNHDFALVESALENGADVNFHGGVLGDIFNREDNDHLIHKKRDPKYYEETDKLLALLLQHGASSTATYNEFGGVINNLMTFGAPNHTILTLLNAVWPEDWQYRLYVGVRLRNSTLVKEALEHGADPNKSLPNNLYYLTSAIEMACRYSTKDEEDFQKRSLDVLRLLFKTTPQLGDESPRNSFTHNDIVYAYDCGRDQENIKPILDLLVQYASPETKQKALDELQKMSGYYNRPFVTLPSPEALTRRALQEENLAWLLKRLQE